MSRWYRGSMNGRHKNKWINNKSGEWTIVGPAGRMQILASGCRTCPRDDADGNQSDFSLKGQLQLINAFRGASSN